MPCAASWRGGSSRNLCCSGTPRPADLQGPMNCQLAQESISRYLDNRLAQPERGSVASHLAGCRQCAALHGRTAQLRKNMLSLPAAVAPEGLVTNLQVLASKEVVRRRHMGSLSALLQFWWEGPRLVIENPRRPLAGPDA